MYAKLALTLVGDVELDKDTTEPIEATEYISLTVGLDKDKFRESLQNVVTMNLDDIITAVFSSHEKAIETRRASLIVEKEAAEKKKKADDKKAADKKAADKKAADKKAADLAAGGGGQ